MPKKVPNFTMPGHDIIAEYQQDSGDLYHTKCGTEYTPESISDGLRWMREHYHECKNEIMVNIRDGVYVKVRLLENGMTEVYVWDAYARQPVDKETVKTARLYSTTSTEKSSSVTVDKDEMDEP